MLGKVQIYTFFLFFWHVIKNNIVTVPHFEFTQVLNPPQAVLFLSLHCLLFSPVECHFSWVAQLSWVGPVFQGLSVCLSMVCCSLLFSWVIFGEITSDYTEIGIKLQWACVLQSWGLSGCLCNFSRHIKCWFLIASSFPLCFLLFPFPSVFFLQKKKCQV